MMNERARFVDHDIDVGFLSVYIVLAFVPISREDMTNSVAGFSKNFPPLLVTLPTIAARPVISILNNKIQHFAFFIVMSMVECGLMQRLMHYATQTVHPASVSRQRSEPNSLIICQLATHFN